MKITSGMDSVLPTPPTNPVHNENNSVSVEGERVAVGNFDQISLSKEPVGERKLQMDLVSRLSVEVRTASISSSELEELHRLVQSGQYHPDPMETAAKMLLLGDE